MNLILLAEASFSYSAKTETANPAVVLVAMLVGLVIQGLLLMGVFKKAGYPAWAAFVPIYNAVILCLIGGKAWWWVILLAIPLVGFILWIILAIAIAERFGKGTGFGIGLAFLSIIFFPILGYGSATYQGAPAPATA